jgi:hypothetical protein
MAAALQQPPQQSTNLAPLKPLLELRDGSRKPDSRISKALKEKFTYYNKLKSEVWNEIYSVGQLVSSFCEGNQILTRNPYTGAYAIVPVKRHDSSTPYAMNFMQFFRQNLIEKWEEATPDVNITPGRNTDQSVIASKGANVIWKHYQKKYYDAWFSQQQCILGHSYGTYVDEVRYDDSEATLTVIRDVFEQKQVTMGDGYGFCPDCQNGGPARQFQPLGEVNAAMIPAKCLECGGESAVIESLGQGTAQSASGTRNESIGDLVCRQHPLPSLKWDLMKRLEDSSYLIVRQRVPKGAVMRLIGNLALPSNDDRDQGLDIIEQSGWTGQALRGRGGYGYGNLSDELKKEQITYDEMYLMPECYADINLMGDEETVGGTTIPKGKLTDIFPDGICVVGLNGMSVILAIYPEKHRDHFVSGVWFMKAMTGAGRGIVDSVEVQKRYNSFDSQRINYWGTLATPATFYDQEMIPGSRLKYLGTPRTNIPVNLTKLPEGRKLAEMLHQFTPASIPGAFLQYTDENLQKAFQYTTMVTNYSGSGTAGITESNDTATAAQIDQSNSDAINGPIFQIKGEVWKREAEITVEQFRRHFPMGRFFSIGGKYGKQQGQMIYGADLCDDLNYEVAKGSHLPKGPMATRQNLMGLFGVTQGAEGYVMLKQADPKLADQLRQGFDVDIDDEEFGAVAEICRRRLDQMKEAEKVGVTEAEALIEAIQPPISSYELHLKDKSQWFAASLDTDELMDASPGLRGACELLAAGQFQGSVQQGSVIAAGAGAVQTAGSMPQALGQKALEPEPAQEEPPQIDPNNVLNLQGQQAQGEMDAVEAEKQRTHEKQQRTHEKTMQAAEHKNKLALVKAKPKPKVTGKK